MNVTIPGPSASFGRNLAHRLLAANALMGSTAETSRVERLTLLAVFDPSSELAEDPGVRVLAGDITDRV